MARGDEALPLAKLGEPCEQCWIPVVRVNEHGRCPKCDPPTLATGRMVNDELSNTAEIAELRRQIDHASAVHLNIRPGLPKSMWDSWELLIRRHLRRMAQARSLSAFMRELLLWARLKCVLVRSTRSGVKRRNGRDNLTRRQLQL